MPRDWEAQFRDWAKPPSKTEEDRCNNAVSAIRNAINANDKLREDRTIPVREDVRIRPLPKVANRVIGKAGDWVVRLEEMAARFVRYGAHGWF